jgi:hypothetical protein
MSTVKVGVSSPDPVLQRVPYSEGALARIAHVNEAIRLLKADVAAVGVLAESTPLAGTAVNTLRPEVETRLDNIEAKLNALITALS